MASRGQALRKLRGEVPTCRVGVAEPWSLSRLLPTSETWVLYRRFVFRISVLTQQAHSSWSVLAHRLAHRRPKKSRSMKQTRTRRRITPARTTKESCNKHTSVLLAVYTTFSAEFTQTKKLLQLRLRKSAQASEKKSVEGVKSETRGEWDFRSTKRLASKVRYLV
jgi:hypothetical protein